MNERVDNTIPKDDKSPLLGILVFLAKHSPMIIIGSAAVAVLTFSYFFCIPSIYKATARLLPPRPNLTLSNQILESLGGTGSTASGVQGLGGGIRSVGGGLMGLRTATNIYVAMINSETVLDRIIDRFGLMDLYNSRYLEDARKDLKKQTNVTVGNKDNIITIQVTEKTPKLAAELANAYIEEFEGLLQGLAIQEAKERLAFLEKEQLEATQYLTKAEEAVRVFSEQNNVLQIDTQTRSAIEYIARLKAEIDAKEVDLEVLRKQATPLNSDVMRMEEELKGLKEKLHSAEAQRENCVSDVCFPTGKAPTLSLEYLRLLREAKFQESRSQLFSKMAEVARLDMVRNVAVVQMLDRAIPPEEPSNKRVTSTIIIWILSLIMLSLVAFGHDYLEDLNDGGDNSKRLMILKEYLSPWRFLRK